MSRSYKKHPHCGYVCFFSNKEDKRNANRKMRRINRQIINNNKSFTKDVEYIYPIDYPDDYDVEVYEYWPIENLDPCDFKLMREVADVYEFESDGLWRPTAEYERVWDNSVPYLGGTDRQHPRTTIAEARRQHNWETLKYYIRK